MLRARRRELLTVRAVGVFYGLDHVDEISDIDAVAVVGCDHPPRNNVYLCPVNPLQRRECLLESLHELLGVRPVYSANLDVSTSIASPHTAPAAPRAGDPGNEAGNRAYGIR